MWLSTFRLKATRPTNKFTQKRIGPFKILQMVTLLAAKLELPEKYSRIHHTVSITQLEPAIASSIPGRHQAAPEPIEIKGEDQYEVKEILNVKKVDERRSSGWSTGRATPTPQATSGNHYKTSTMPGTLLPSST